MAARLLAKIMFLWLLFEDLIAIYTAFNLGAWGFVVMVLVIAPVLWLLGTLALLAADEPRAALLFSLWPILVLVAPLVCEPFGVAEAFWTGFFLTVIAVNLAVLYAIHLVLGRPMNAQAVG